jgi:hypothetical protein
MKTTTTTTTTTTATGSYHFVDKAQITMDMMKY